MRYIHVDDGLRLCFPGRDETFDEGVEAGLLIANLAAGPTEFTLRLATVGLEQAGILAERMGYRTHVVQTDGPWSDVMFLTGRRRPKLMLVHTSRCEASN